MRRLARAAAALVFAAGLTGCAAVRKCPKSTIGSCVLGLGWLWMPGDCARNYRQCSR